MADVIGSAEFELRANKDRLIREALEAERELKAQVRRIEREYGVSASEARQAWSRAQREMAADARAAEQEIKRSANGIGRAVAQMAGALAAAFSIREIGRMADDYTALQNRIRVTGLEGEALLAVQQRLFDSASRHGVSVSALAELYGRLALVQGELGVSTEEILGLTDGVTAALRVQGTSTQAASGALLQLAQALGSGVVRAEEINSILEATPTIAQAAANGMDMSVAQLRNAIVAGEITSRQFFDALMAGFPAIEAQAQDAALTMGQALTGLGNRLMEYVGATDESLGASERMAQAIKALGDNIDKIIPILAALTVGLGVSYVGGLVAAHRATLTLTAAMGGLRAAMTLISAHPIIAILTVLAAGLTYVALQTREAIAATEDYQRANTALEQATRAYDEAARAAAIATGEEAEAARQAAAQKRDLAVAARDAARAKLAEAAATLALVQAESARFTQTERYNIRGDRPGNYAEAGRISAAAGQAQVNYDAVVSAIRDANAAIAEADATLAASRQRQSGGGGGGGADRAAASAAAAAEAAEREAAALQAAQKRKQEEIDELARQTAIAEAIKRKQDHEEAYALASEQATNAAQGRLEHEIALAGLSGRWDVLEALERQRWINERINELMSERYGLTLAEAEAQANREAGERAAAGREGDLRGEFRRAFTDGMKAAIDGDVGGLFESLADRFTDRMLENLADDLFTLLMDAADVFNRGGIAGAGGSGGGWLSSLFSGLGGLFGGGRAAGGPVSAGMIYRVGEHGPETLIMPRDGMVIPNQGFAAGSGQSGGGPREIIVRVQSDDPKFRAFIQETTAPAIAASHQSAVSTATGQMASGMAESQRRAWR